MTDRRELRLLAEEATPGPWMVDYQSSYPAGEMVVTEDSGEIAFAQKHGTAAFIAAASPDVALGLLDEIEGLKQNRAGECDFGLCRSFEAERDEYRAVAVWLKEALEILAAQTSGIPGSTARADCMASIASIALSDPEVEKL